MLFLLALFVLKRMIGSTDQYNEDEYSSYVFNNVKGKNRTTPYHHLFKDTCYSFSIFQSTQLGSSYAKLFYQYESETKVILSSSNTITCQKLYCKKGSKDPFCIRFVTCIRRYKFANTFTIQLFVIISL